MTKQVLILDDNADNRELLFFALKAGDYAIHQAMLGQEAAAFAASHKIDLALLDIELPDVNGLEVARRIRGLHPDAVLIMLSANDNRELLEQARKLGANAYIVKPFNLRQVLELVRQWDEGPAEARLAMRVI